MVLNSCFTILSNLDIDDLNVKNDMVPPHVRIIAQIKISFLSVPKDPLLICDIHFLITSYTSLTYVCRHSTEDGKELLWQLKTHCVSLYYKILPITFKYQKSVGV